MSADKVYVYSTLTCDQLYTEWLKGGGDLPVQGRQVLVKGGAGVANDRLVTPLGVRTEISREDMQVLQACPVFVDHEKRGFVMVDDTRIDPEVIAADMERADGSAPLTPSSYENAAEGVAKPRD